MSDKGELISFNSSRFGITQIEPEKVITVPEGIIGFPQFRRYALLKPPGESSLFLWLHSLDNPDLAFILTDPLIFVPDFNISTEEPDLARLGLTGKNPPALFVIVTVPADNPDKININLMAPLLFFSSDNTLYQIVIEKEIRPLRHYIFGEREKSANPGGNQTPDENEGGAGKNAGEVL